MCRNITGLVESRYCAPTLVEMRSSETLELFTPNSKPCHEKNSTRTLFFTRSREGTQRVLEQTRTIVEGLEHFSRAGETKHWKDNVPARTCPRMREGTAGYSSDSKRASEGRDSDVRWMGEEGESLK